MPVKTINVEGIGQVTIVRRRGIRSMRLNVDNQGSIRLTLPWWVSVKTGLDFAQAKSDWIKSQKIGVKFNPRDNMLFGKNLQLRIEASHSKRPSKRLDGQILAVRIEGADLSIESNAAYLTKSMTWALRIQAEKLLLPRIRILADNHGQNYASCTVRQLKSRWGSCNSQRDIVLNLYLIQLPWELIDYVLLHELNHTQHLYHGPVFWKALEDICPEAKKLRKRLHAYQPRLYDALEP